MNRLTTTHNWRTLLVVFVAGMLVGLFVLGWGLFPVKWTNANLRDLREGAQNNYLAAVADSYAAGGNFDLAQQRLKEWTPAEARTRLDKLAARYGAEGRIQQAQNVQSLADAVQAAPAAAPPIATPTITTGIIQRNSSLLTLLCLLLGVLVIGAGLGLLAWVIVARLQQPAAIPAGALPTIEPLPTGNVIDGEIIGAYSADAEPPSRLTATTTSYRPPPPIPDTVSTLQEPALPVAAPASLAHEMPASTTLVPGKRLAEFDAVYHQGDTDYDEAFVVDGEAGAGYRGECGMGIASALDSDSTQATALEVWLFDKSDIHTVTTVLISDHAQGNPALHERLAEKGDILPIAPNQIFTIQAKTLALKAEVTSVTYAEGAGEPRSVFEYVTIHLTVYALEA